MSSLAQLSQMGVITRGEIVVPVLPATHHSLAYDYNNIFILDNKLPIITAIWSQTRFTLVMGDKEIEARKKEDSSYEYVFPQPLFNRDLRQQTVLVLSRARQIELRGPEIIQEKYFKTFYANAVQEVV